MQVSRDVTCGGVSADDIGRMMCPPSKSHRSETTAD